MPKYAQEAQDVNTSVKTRGSYLRVSFKNTHEVIEAIKGMKLRRAQKYLQDVIQHKDAIPFRKFTGGIGHHAQAKRHNAVACRWPEKACRYVLDLLQNAASNAGERDLDVDTLFVSHAQVNKAPYMRRRTYRAHGRINAYMSSPCHVEIIFSAKSEQVAKPADAAPRRNKKTAQLTNGATAETA